MEIEYEKLELQNISGFVLRGYNINGELIEHSWFALNKQSIPRRVVKSCKDEFKDYLANPFSKEGESFIERALYNEERIKKWLNDDIT